VGGAAADATGFFVEGDEFDGLSCDELAEAAPAGEVGVGGGGLAQAQAEALRCKVFDVNGAAFAG
jgi:hypothetical protein